MVYESLVKEGKMAERSKAADCKSVGNTNVGSNPTLFTIVVTKYERNTLIKKRFEFEK